MEAQMALTPEQLLHTRIVVTGDRACVQIAGELDMATATEVDRAVRDCLTCHPRHLELDLDCLTFCDATGLRALRRARETAQAQGCSFQLTGITPHVRRIFALLLVPEPLSPPYPAAPEPSRSGRPKNAHVPR
jgi:anti-anti-sigma factor